MPSEGRESICLPLRHKDSVLFLFYTFQFFFPYVISLYIEQTVNTILGLCDTIPFRDHNMSTLITNHVINSTYIFQIIFM